MTPVFGRIKGQAETSLLQLRGYRGEGLAGMRLPVEASIENTELGLQPICVRPGFVDAAGHDDIRPYIPQPPLLYALSEVLLGPVVRRLVPSMHSPTRDVGKVLLQFAEGKVSINANGENVDDGDVINAKGLSSLARKM